MSKFRFKKTQQLMNENKVQYTPDYIPSKNTHMDILVSMEALQQNMTDITERNKEEVEEMLYGGLNSVRGVYYRLASALNLINVDAEAAKKCIYTKKRVLYNVDKGIKDCRSCKDSEREELERLVGSYNHAKKDKAGMGNVYFKLKEEKAVLEEEIKELEKEYSQQHLPPARKNELSERRINIYDAIERIESDFFTLKSDISDVVLAEEELSSLVDTYKEGILNVQQIIDTASERRRKLAVEIKRAENIFAGEKNRANLLTMAKVMAEACKSTNLLARLNESYSNANSQKMEVVKNIGNIEDGKAAARKKIESKYESTVEEDIESLLMRGKNDEGV